MSTRLTRRQSDAMESTAPPSKPTRKSAASPAGSRKKKAGAAAASVRSPSPAPLAAASSSSATTSPSRVRRGRPSAATGAAARAATPNGRTSGRPMRHVNSRGADYDVEEEEAVAAALAGDGSDSDLESVGSRASHQPLRNRNQKYSNLSASQTRSPPPPLVGLFPDAAGGRGVRWDEAAQSPTGAGTDVLPSDYVATIGSVPPRKGSDHRRATVAAQKRDEAKRLETSFKAMQAEKEALARQRQKKRGFCRSLLRICMWMLGLTLVAVGVGFAWTMHSMTDEDSGAVVTDPVRLVAATMATRFPRARHSIESVLEPALRHHVDSFTAVRRSDDDGGSGAATAEWLGGMAVLQPRKPLTLVLATNSAAQGAGSSVALQFLDDLRLLLAQDSPQALERVAAVMSDQGHKQPLSDSTSPALRCLDLRQSYSQALDTRGVRTTLQNFFAPNAPAVVFGYARTAVDALVALLPPGLLSAQSACAALHASVERGAVLVRGAQAFPRSAAEAFHYYADDVAAPVPRALLVFEVDIGAQPMHLHPAEAARRTLEESWSKGPEPDTVVSRDEVLRPLLSRILRNVIDLSAL